MRTRFFIASAVAALALAFAASPAHDRTSHDVSTVSSILPGAEAPASLAGTESRMLPFEADRLELETIAEFRIVDVSPEVGTAAPRSEFRDVEARTVQQLLKDPRYRLVEPSRGHTCMGDLECATPVNLRVNVEDHRVTNA